MLAAWRDGDDRALERLVPVMYRELRRIAGIYMRNERDDHTWQPTALVHEALLRFVRQENRCYDDRGHFLAVMATIMRRVLVDYARRRLRVKRGGNAVFVPLEEANCPVISPSRQIVALDEALEALARADQQQAKLVELRFFAGLSVEETAGVLGISTRTVKRRWRTARIWLYERLNQPPAA